MQKNFHLRKLFKSETNHPTMISFSRFSLFVALAGTSNVVFGQRPRAPRNMNPGGTLGAEGRMIGLDQISDVVPDQILDAVPDDIASALLELLDVFVPGFELSMSMETTTAVPSDQPSDSPSSSPSAFVSSPPTTPAPTTMTAAPSTAAPSTSPSESPSVAQTMPPTDPPTNPGPITITSAPIVRNGDVIFDTSAPTPSPGNTKCPGITDQERYDQIIARLDQVADEADILNPATPQGKATIWIIEQDEFNSCPQDLKLIQRWALAVIYFSTNGDDWFECSANPTATDDCGSKRPFINKERFLSSGTECDWAGISCNVDGCVTEIEFGKFGDLFIFGTMNYYF